MKLCINCRFYCKQGKDSPLGTAHICERTFISPITGDTIPDVRDCRFEREQARIAELAPGFEICGREGKFWEAK